MEGTNEPFMRSRCSRSIMTMSASSQAFAHVTENFDAQALDAGRQQCRRRDDAHARAERIEQDNVRTRHARMQNVAADRDGQPSIRALVAADGECVEQRLGRMLVRAVAGVDHGAIDFARQEIDRAGRVWRTTRMSGCMALSVIAVSISVSPLRMEEEPTDMFITSAPRRLPAISNEDWVRVEDSKKRLIWVRPRSVALLLVDLAVGLDEVLGAVEETDDLARAKVPRYPTDGAG